MSIFLAIVALSVIILVHEIGHFIAAKACGIKVLEFSLFMGPKIFSVKKGETQFTVRWIPIGGYVKMEGEETDSDDSRAFNKQPVWKRIVVVSAGALMNILFTLIVLSVLVGVAGFESTTVNNIADLSYAQKQGLQKGDRVVSYDGKSVLTPMDVDVYSYLKKDGELTQLGIVRAGTDGNKTLDITVNPVRIKYVMGVVLKVVNEKVTNTVDQVSPGTPAEKAGVLSGDTIRAVNGINVTDQATLATTLSASGSNEAVLDILRADGSSVEIKLTPVSQRITEAFAIGYDYDFKTTANPFAMISQAGKQAISTTRSVGYSLAWLVTGKVSVKELMGPVGIVGQIGTAVSAEQGASNKALILFSYMAFISLNIGLVQFIPFPALDGSKIVIYLVEKVRKKPLPPEKEALITMIGFVALMSLILFISFNDIIKQFK